ncbi:MAG: hypothetical protein IJ315_06190 [Firmicutes bacterium]|nr:hypothetical protein [Bacillota bacterium]
MAAQDGREFEKQGYEKIKKVYSIWICPEPTAAERNCINLYELHEVQKVGRMKQDRSAYDKLSIVLINLGPKDEAQEGILRMLEVLFSRERPVEERLEILKEEYDIPVNKGLEKGVSEVCNLSIGYYLDGLRDGKAEGEAEGRHETLAANLRTVMENMNCSLKQAMDFLRVPEEERSIYIELIPE